MRLERYNALFALQDIIAQPPVNQRRQPYAPWLVYTLLIQRKDQLLSGIVNIAQIILIAKGQPLYHYIHAKQGPIL
jgi:hypothetical protein